MRTHDYSVRADFDVWSAATYCPIGGSQDEVGRWFHPVIGSSLPKGNGARQGTKVPFRTLQQKTWTELSPAWMVQTILATLASHESSQQPDIQAGVTWHACESMGDVVEAVGGTLSPFLPAAGQLRVELQADGASMEDCTDAFKDLSLLARSVTELMWLLGPDEEDPGVADMMIPVLRATWAAVTPARSPPTRSGDRTCRICQRYTDAGLGGILLTWEQAQDMRSAGDEQEADNPPEWKATEYGKRRRIAQLKPNQENKEGGPRYDLGHQRTPPEVLDTRFSIVRYQSHFRCDSCQWTFYGRRAGNFVQSAREVSKVDLGKLWERGEVDASWYCTDCWRQHYSIETLQETKAFIGTDRMQLYRQPWRVDDHRFHDKSMRWFLCDFCGEYFPGRDREHLPGSFVYNQECLPAGPPQVRSFCFPAFRDRRFLWKKCQWRADWACRRCLAGAWMTEPDKVEEWLGIEPRRNPTRTHQVAPYRAPDDPRRRRHLELPYRYQVGQQRGLEPPAHLAAWAAPRQPRASLQPRPDDWAEAQRGWWAAHWPRTQRGGGQQGGGQQGWWAASSGRRNFHATLQGLDDEERLAWYHANWGW